VEALQRFRILGARRASHRKRLLRCRHHAELLALPVKLRRELRSGRTHHPPPVREFGPQHVSQLVCCGSRDGAQALSIA
jgi:hypothetical protein